MGASNGDKRDDMLLFFIDEEGFSIPTHFIEEIIDRKEIFKLPLLPDSISGLICYKRELIPVISPSLLSRVNHSEDEQEFYGVEMPERDAFFLIIRYDQLLFAIVADRVVSITRMKGEKVMQETSHKGKGRHRDRSFLFKDMRFKGIDVDHLIGRILNEIGELA